MSSLLLLVNIINDYFVELNIVLTGCVAFRMVNTRKMARNRTMFRRDDDRRSPDIRNCASGSETRNKKNYFTHRLPVRQITCKDLVRRLLLIMQYNL
jgi:hypothetical protein